MAKAKVAKIALLKSLINKANRYLLLYNIHYLMFKFILIIIWLHRGNSEVKN